MSELDTLDTTDSGPSLRDHIESSVASHSPGPDIESITNTAVDHDRAARHRDREKPVDHYQHEGDRTNKLRSDIRNSLHQKKLEAAAGPTQSTKSHEASPGAPASWDLGARAAWDSLPQEVRLAVQREESQMMNGLEQNVVPRLREHAEIAQVLAPVSERYRQQGLSAAQAVGRLVEWENALFNPQTKHQAAMNLLAQVGVSVHDLLALAGQPQAYQQYAQQYDPVAAQQQQEEMVVQQHLHQFSQGRFHFQNVRHRMGELIRDFGERYVSRDGTVDLSAAYTDACREAGLGDNHGRRAASSPRSRPPAMRNDSAIPSGGSVRRSIVEAINQARG